MLTQILFAVGSLLIIAVSCMILFRVSQNYKAHRFFKLKSPNLPVLPNTNIFTGHAGLVYWNPNNWRNLDELHKKFGQTFGFFAVEKPVISTTDLDFIKAMVIDKPNDHIDRPALNIPVTEFTKDDIVFVRGEQWWRIRKAMAPAFSNHKIMSPNVQDEINAVVDRFVGSIELKLDCAHVKNNRTSISFDADDGFTRYAIALVFSCFYKQENIVDFDSKHDYYVKMIEDAAQGCVNPLMISCFVFPILIPMAEWMTTHFSTQGQLIRKIKEFIKRQTILNLKAKREMQRSDELNEREKLDQADFIMSDGTRFRRNMIDHIIDQFHLGKLSESEYINSTFFLFLAATKTAGDALSRLVYHLAVHQDVQARLRGSVFADGVNSEYLHWCISESLRLFPPVTAGCSRQTGRDITTKDGILIPAGTNVVTPAFTICRLKEFWGPDADEFKPDRWRDAKSFHPIQYLAFGAGKRNCLGKEFALCVIKKLMAEMMLRYQFLPSPRTTAESIMQFGSPSFIFLTPNTPTYVEICRL